MTQTQILTTCSGQIDRNGYCTRCGKVALTSSTVCLRLEDVTEQAGINMVLAVSGPSVDEINKFLDDYGFVVPYDGSNKFYDETKIRHAKSGIDFVMNWIKEKGGIIANEHLYMTLVQKTHTLDLNY